MPRFTLEQAQALMPKVLRLTGDAVAQVEALVAQGNETRAEEPQREVIGEEIRAVVEAWAASIRGLGAEVKGLWLVDFDNGEGYYCWRHPEESLGHFHTYEAGFSGREPIVPETLH